MASASMGHQARMAFDSELPFDASSEPYEFTRESLRKQGRIVDTSGIRGTRSHSSERTREGTYTVAGEIVLPVSPEMLDLVLPRILGGAENLDAFDLEEALPEFQVMIDRVARVFTYEGCRVHRGIFRGRAGELIELQLDVVGRVESVAAAGTFPALAMPLDPPYVFHDGVLTLQGMQRQFTQFELVIDNDLVSRFTNSQAATDVSPRDRIVTFRCANPFTAEEIDLYGQSALGGAASLVLTNGGYSTTFNFPALQFPDRSPVVEGRGEIPLVLEATARRTATDPELSIVHDAAA